MKSTVRAASGAALVLLLAACGGGSGDTETVAPQPAAEEQVPGSAGSSVDAFVAYLSGLVSSDDAEPAGMEKFVAPLDDTSDN